ncbi:MAG TPA: serine hydrolase domain-containing protein [Gemmatimonadales bacterium]|nr:serine hydrolase domain-containing protein [Gemmatimonadales bacterium]
MMQVALLLLVTLPLAAQPNDSALVLRIDSIFASVNRTSTPGCAIGVDRAGTPIVRRAYGMANLETGTPWTVGTISESGSTAKQFTAAGLVLLARDGVLSLDDDITRWIPEVRGLGKRITIRHLLTHTSGLPDRYTLHEVAGRPAGEVDHANTEVLDLVAHLRELNFDPGEDYLYSNTGYIVAATVLERASGKSLQALTGARIFRPLGMTSTRWREDHRVVIPGRASAYTGSFARGWSNDHPFTRVIGSGGLLTTVDDYLKWQAALQNGAEPWGAVRDSLEHMGRLNGGTELSYGLGVSADRWRGVRRVSHTGSTGGYRAVLHRYPEQNVAIAILCNGGSAVPGDLGSRVAAQVLGTVLAAAEPDPVAGSGNSIDLGALAGAYHAPRTEEILILQVRDDRLVDSTSNNAVLIPVAADRLQYQGGRRTVTVVSAASPVRLRIEAPNTRAVEYIAVSREEPSPAALAGYAGEYRSVELESNYRIMATGDTLRLERGWRAPVVLTPLYRDGFRAGGQGLIRFVRDGRGRVTGFVLWAGRVRHLRFEREKVMKGVNSER